MSDEKLSTTAKIDLPAFPGEVVLAHEGRNWKVAATVKLAPYELVVVAETTVPPAVNEIIDVVLDDFPELPPNHPQHERRKSERIRFQQQNDANVEKRARMTLRSWTLLFESLRSCCVPRAPLLAEELFELCALEHAGVAGGYFDGPRAWQILLQRIEGDGERTEYDKGFYITALQFQQNNRLSNGCTASEFQKRAFAFVQYIMPNLAQKFEPNDAAEYILKMMPDELYEAGQRVKFAARMDGRFTDLKYLIRLCSNEVFQKQKGTAPKPTFIGAPALGGHDLELFATCCGVDELQLRGPDRDDPSGGAMFVGNDKRWCDQCPHKRGTCICDPYNSKPPPPSVYLDTNRWRTLMAKRDEHGANESPPFKPKPVPKPSDADMKKYKDIIAKRNKERKPRGEKNKDKDKDKQKESAGGAAGETSSLQDFFDGLVDATDDAVGIAAAGVTDGPSPGSTAEFWCLVADSTLMTGVHPSSAISDERWRAIVDSGGSVYEFDTEDEANEALDMFSHDDYFVDAPAAADNEPAAVVAPAPPLAAPAAAPAEPPTTPGLRPPAASATARYAAPGDRLGPTPLPFGVSQCLSRTTSAYSPYVPPSSPTSDRPLPPPTPLPVGAPCRPSAQSRVPAGMPTRTSGIRLGGVCTSIEELMEGESNAKRSVKRLSMPKASAMRRSKPAPMPAPAPPPAPVTPSPAAAPSSAASPQLKSHTQAWVVSGASDENNNGVWFTTTEAELTEVHALSNTATVTNHGFGEPGEIAAREAWSKIKLDPDPIVKQARTTKLMHSQQITLAVAAVIGLIAWRVTSILMASKDLPIAAGLLAGAVPFYVDPNERGPLLVSIVNFMIRLMYHMAHLANRHGAVTCTLVGMFFLVRGTSGAEISTPRLTCTEPSYQGEAHPDDDDKPENPGGDVADHPELATATGTYQPPLPCTPTIICCPNTSGLPRADLLTFEQAGQLHHELLAGCEVPEGLPKSITHVLAIADSGCATSMGNHADQFRAGSIIDSPSKVIGVSGPMTVGQRGDLQFPMITESHGMRKWLEKNAIKNELCPYLLLALGRASRERGVEMHMPRWGTDGHFSYPNGVVVKLYNRNVLALRPLGYKPSPSAGLAMTPKMLGIPDKGNWVAFICSGHRRDGDVTSQAVDLKVGVPIVPFDIKIGGESHDVTSRKFVTTLISAMSGSGNSTDSRGECIGTIISIRCKTWSVSHHLPDAKGNPPDPPRAWPDHILGKKDSKGDIPPAIAEANTESEHAAEIANVAWARGGFVMAETPARRRRGSTHFDKHILKECDDHAHMLDHPAWVTFSHTTKSIEVPWDQCVDAPVPEEAPIKSSLWLVTPNIGGAVKIEFGNNICHHPLGTHKPLRGVDSNGTYLTASSKCENYHPASCRRVARCVYLFVKHPESARLPSRVDAEPSPCTHKDCEHHDKPPPPRDKADYETALAGGTFRICVATAIIRGKHLPDSAICYEFVHRSFVHAEDRVLRHLPDALSDADEKWLNAMKEHATKPPCEACITGNAPRLGPSGALPRDEGLIFLDIMHISVPCMFTGHRIVVGVTHAKSGKRKTVRVGSKDQAHLAMEIVLAYFNSLGKPVTWIHTDGANELKGSKMVPLARSKNIRITTTVKHRSRQNPQEPSWRAQMAGTRKTLQQANLPVGFWGAAWDDTEEGQSLIPSREPPFDCSLGRLLSTDDKTVKPSGSHRRPFGSLCYPVTSERLPSGTLVNKAAAQSRRAILLGYSGGRSGDFEALGVARSQPGYICYIPETNSTVVTDDVYICWKIQPGLERTSGGGWQIPSSRIPFSSEFELEREKERVSREHGSGEKPDVKHEENKPVEIKHDDEIPDSDDGDTEFNSNALELRFGYPEEPPPADDQAPSRGGDSENSDDTAAQHEQEQPAAPKAPRRYLVPRNHYPEYPCEEHGGTGWEVIIVAKKGVWARCRFTAHNEDGNPWEDVWRKTADLIDLDTLSEQTGSDESVETPAELQPSIPNSGRPAALEPTPTDVTGPAPGTSDPLKEPTRPTRSRKPTDFFGEFATPALGSMRDVAALARFDPESPRLTSETLAVATEGGGHRLAQRLEPDMADDGAPALLSDIGEHILDGFDALEECLQRVIMIMCDHDESSVKHGATAPETTMLRSVYAAAMVEAAKLGHAAPPLDPLFAPLIAQEGASLCTFDEMFDESHDGVIFSTPNLGCDPTIIAAAKAKTSPHIFSERQMRGPRWDTPKQLEIAKMDRLNAKIDIAADDSRIAHLRPVETMWTGREKIDSKGNIVKDNARCVARGDLHSKYYEVSSNQSMSPVVRTPSLNAIDAVSALRRQHMCPFDVPGAYLQGTQRPTEQIVCRPPVGFRKYDERGVEILWLMLSPLYGQADSGAIWNRTWNDYVTEPEGCGYERCPQEPCVYSKRLGDVHEDKPTDSYVTLPIYVDDGRIYYDPSAEATSEATRDRERLHQRFGIEFKAIDPKDDYFLGANRRASDDRSSCKLTATTYIEDMGKRFLPDVDVTKPSAAMPSAWSHTPADEQLVKAWEEATMLKPKAPEKLMKKYGSLYGALLHASKYRPEILAAMGLLGSALTFPTEQLYMHLVRVLVYLLRTRSLGITYSAHAPHAHTLRARADSNWSETRSTTGFVIFLAGATINNGSRRQHCISMSSCEAELIALAETAIELIHTDATLEFIGHRREGPIVVGTDNKGAYDLCHRFTSAQNSRHIDRKLFKMREMRGAGVVTVELIPTAINPADIFTKILSRQTFEKHRKTVLNIMDDSDDGPTATALAHDHFTAQMAVSRGGSVALLPVPCAA